MNDNKNGKKEKKDSVKSNKEKKLKIKKIGGYTAYIYLALAICIVTALTIGIFSLTYDYEEIDNPPRISIPDISVPDISITDISEAPVQGDESDVDDIIIEPEPVYKYPVENGNKIKDYTIDALVFSETMQDYRVHTGVDIAAEEGAAVLVYTDGTVAEIKSDPFFGTTIVIEHSHGLTSYYMNLATEIPEEIVVGKAVEAGDIIGAVGTTAIIESADEPHLHFELRVGGELINPSDEFALNDLP